MSGICNYRYWVICVCEYESLIIPTMVHTVMTQSTAVPLLHTPWLEVPRLKVMLLLQMMPMTATKATMLRGAALSIR